MDVCGTDLLGRTSLYLFFSSAPGGTSDIVVILEGIDCVCVRDIVVILEGIDCVYRHSGHIGGYRLRVRDIVDILEGIDCVYGTYICSGHNGIWTNTQVYKYD